MGKQLPSILFLCGFMGSGKSAIGQRLAERTGASFADLDSKIEEKAGKKIAQIFKDEGESSFRKTELYTLQEIISTFKGILALGGGSLQNQGVVDQIKAKSLLIFIDSPISVILKRISQNKNRPLLLDKDGNLKSRERLKDELQSLYEIRRPLYEQADIKLINDGEQSLQKLVTQLLTKIKDYASGY